LALGIAAFDSLPPQVALADARLFADAVRYLFAYEQLMYRQTTPRVDARAYEGLLWLFGSLPSFVVGKADGMQERIRSSADLRNKGLAALDSVHRSDSHGTIWDVTAFITASANLFAFIECTDRPNADVAKKLNWLLTNSNRLVTAGIKADSPGLESATNWLPLRTKPQASLTEPELARSLAPSLPATRPLRPPAQDGNAREAATSQLKHERDSLRARTIRLEAMNRELD
jgi:hypothetical protein